MAIQRGKRTASEEIQGKGELYHRYRIAILSAILRYRDPMAIDVRGVIEKADEITKFAMGGE